MSKPLAVFTTQTFSQTSLQPGGAVFANRVEIINVSKNAGISEGRNILMEKKIGELTRSLMGELDIQAKKMYPTSVALVNVDLHLPRLSKTGLPLEAVGSTAGRLLTFNYDEHVRKLVKKEAAATSGFEPTSGNSGDDFDL